MMRTPTSELNPLPHAPHSQSLSKRYQKPAGTSYLGRKARDSKQSKVKKNFRTHEARTSDGEDIPGSNPTFTHGNSEDSL